MTMNMCLRSAELNERQFLRHSELQEAVLSNYFFCTKTDVKIAKLHLKQTPASFGHCRWEREQHSKRLRYKKQIKHQHNSQWIIQKYPNLLDTQTHRLSRIKSNRTTANNGVKHNMNKTESTDSGTIETTVRLRGNEEWKSQQIKFFQNSQQQWLHKKWRKRQTTISEKNFLDQT